MATQEEESENHPELTEVDGPNGDDQLQLLNALMEENNETFHHLLQQSTVNPNHKYKNQKESACIHIAARRGNDVALYLLSLDGQTNVNEVDQHGRTALHFAAKYFGSIKDKTENYEKCIKILMKWPEVDMNKFDRNGFTPIYEAALANKKEVVQIMLKYGQDKIDLDKLQGDGNSARNLISKNYPEIAAILSPAINDLSRHDPYVQLLDMFENQQYDNFKALLYSTDSEGNAKIDPNYFYQSPYNATLLEIACKQDGIQYKDYVQLLLDAGADPNIINPITNQTPLHLAAHKVNVPILETLISSSKMYVNLKDEEGKTALHILAETTKHLSFEKDRIHNCILFLLNHKKLDVNICDQNGLPAILTAAQKGNAMIVDAIIQNCWDKLDLDSIVNNHKFSELLQQCSELSALIETKEQNIPSKTQGNIKEQLFQHLYSRNIDEFKELFLEQVNKGTHKSILNSNDGSQTFLQYAARYGLCEIAHLLLSHGANPNAIHPKNNKCPLILACIHGRHDILKLLLKLEKEIRIDTNASDKKGNTALYYAAWNRDLKSVVTLLRHGATLDHRNIYGNLPITYNAMESLLDQCITSSGHPEDDDYKLEFDYSFLLAYRNNDKPNLEDSIISIKVLFDNDDHQNSTMNNQTDESTLLVNGHPESNKTKRNVHTGTVKKSEGSEMEFLHYISIYEDYKSLLNHPLLRSFLHLKWLHAAKTYYANLIVFIFYMILLNTYILLDIKLQSSDLPEYSKINNSEVEVSELKPSENYASLLVGMKVIVTFIVLCFAIREICQYIGSTGYYVKNPENYLDVGLIITTVIVMYNDWSESRFEQTVTVIAIILSWLELVLITGRHPLLSKNIAMFKAVSKNYFWFLLSYSFLILAFALSFYILFHKNTNTFFHEPGTSLFKTTIMMLGEYDTSSFSFHIVDTTTYIVYLIFVLFMGIVLSNLLTGLAVKDTQSIMQTADQLSLVSRIQLIYQMEQIFLTWSEFLKNVCPSIMTKTANKLKGHMNIFKHKQLYILPNKQGKIIFGNNLKNSSVKLNLDILHAAMKIIAKKGSISETESINVNLEDIKLEQKRIFELQQASLFKLQNNIDNNNKKAIQNTRSSGKFHNKLNAIKQKVEENKYQTQENAAELKNINKRLATIEQELLQNDDQIRQHNSELNKILTSNMETQQLLQKIMEKLNDTN